MKYILVKSKNWDGWNAKGEIWVYDLKTYIYIYTHTHTYILLYFQEGKCREKNIVLGDRIFEFMNYLCH